LYIKKVNEKMIKKMSLIKHVICCSIFFVVAHNQARDFFSKVIIWGHPLHSHTHSYIHAAFYRAFEYLGYEVYWVENMDQLDGVDVHNALFITEGQVDVEMPKRNDCYYILHNTYLSDYIPLFAENRCIALQVYTHDCLPYVTEKIANYIYSNKDEKMIFMPWATDLLPDEIDRIKKYRKKKKKEFRTKKRKERVVNWVGTIGEGFYGNYFEIAGFKKACEENNIPFNQYGNVSMQDGIDLIKASYMSPALQGTWQCQKGYIPCRIFKNISYGQWGITNNVTVHDLFKGKIIYNTDTYQLFYDAQKYINEASSHELYELMDFVRDNHTYINRIQTLITFMKQALHIKEEDNVY